MSTSATEFKVKAAATASFVASLAGVLLLEEWAPKVIAELPTSVQAMATAGVVTLVTWLSGRAARSRPDAISESTLEAVRVRAAKLHRNPEA